MRSTFTQRRICFLLIAFSLLVAHSERSIAQELSVSLNLGPNPPAEIFRWTSGQVDAVFTIYSTDNVDRAATLQVTIKQDNVAIATTESDVKIHLGVNTYTGRNLVRFSEINIKNGFSRFQHHLLTTSRLPSGNYQFCVSILNSAGQQLPVSGNSCANFTISEAQPPRLRFPQNNAKLYGSERKSFEWEPTLWGAGSVSYHFKLVKVYPDQTPTNAFLGNPALYEATTSITSLLWSNALFASEPGLYAWSVQAVDQNGYPLGDPDGWSDLFVFTILESDGLKFARAGLDNRRNSEFDSGASESDIVTFESVEPDVADYVGKVLDKGKTDKEASAVPSFGGSGKSVDNADIDTAGNGIVEPNPFKRSIAGGESSGDSLIEEGETLQPNGTPDSTAGKKSTAEAKGSLKLLFENTAKKGQRELMLGPEIVRYQNIIFHDTLLESKEPIFTDFFEDTISITIREKKKLKYGTKWVGSIVNDQESYVLFVRRGDIIIGNMIREGVLYQVRDYGGGIHKLIEIDQSKFKGEGEPVVPESKGSSGDSPDTDPPDRIDVMVLYTQSAKEAAGGASSVEAEILLAVEETNLAYVQSGIGHRLELVNIVGTSYPESGDLSKDLTWLENNNIVATLRDQSFADIVMMMVEKGNYNGLANIMAYPDHSAEGDAFGVVQRVPATGNYTFGHETGHILGCHHDCQTDEAGTPVYRYAHGYRDTVGKRGTIMADQMIGYRRIPLFSNPSLGSRREAIGTMEGECPSCEACLMEKTAGIVANFRHGPEGADNVWMKDTWNDIGAEPNPGDSIRYLWSTPWIEVLRDTGVSLDPQHRIPVAGQPRWVAVTLRNGSRDTAFGVLQLYYKAASLSAVWDSSWTLLSATSGQLSPDTAQTFNIEWKDVPGYDDYSIAAKWVSASDSMHATETEDLSYNALQNNNIVWKNEHLLEMIPSTSTRADVTFQTVPNSTIEVLCSPASLSKQTFSQEAGSVRVEFDQQTSKLLKKKGIGDGIARDEAGGFAIEGEKGGVFHLPMARSVKEGRLSLFFEAKEASSPAKYPIHIVQKSADGKIIGGVSYLLVYTGDQGNKWQKPDSVVNSVQPGAPITENKALEEVKDEKVIFLTGSASIFVEGYQGSDLNVRQSPFFGRVILSPILRYSNRFSLPFKVAFFIHNGLQQKTSSSSFLQTLANPANSFGLSPTFGQLKINIGSHTPELSGLVGSNVQLFGLGFDVRFGSFKVVLSGGLSQPEINSDTAANQVGRYARIMGVGKLALEKEKVKAGLNFLYITDDTGSIENPILPSPERNIVTTLNAAFPINEAISIEGEVGGSIFTRDTRAEVLDRNAEILKNDFLSTINDISPLKVSTAVDVAALLRVNVNKEITRKKKNWDLAADVQYIGAGYRSLALPYMRSDRLSASIAPNLELMGGKLFLSGEFGWNRDNVSGYGLATTNELHTSLDASWLISGAFRLNAGYGNVWQHRPSDTVLPGAKSNFQQVRITPSYQISNSAATHFLLATAAIIQRDQRIDSFVAPAVSASSTTQMFSAMYSLSLVAIPLMADAELTFTNDATPFDTLSSSVSSQRGTIGVGYKFLQDRMPCRLYLTILYSPLTYNDLTTSGRQTIIGGNLDWKMTGQLRLSGRIEIDAYQVPIELRGGLGMEWKW